MPITSGQKRYCARCDKDTVVVPFNGHDYCKDCRVNYDVPAEHEETGHIKPTQEGK